jgi:transposase
LQTIEEDERQAFFKQWMEIVTDKECLYYDLTSVSSYSELNEYVKWGYNRDGEHLPQINLGMLFGQSSGLPVYYRRLPGSVGDVSALKKTISSLNFIGHDQLTFVMDRGFYSETNVDALFAAKMKFVLAIPHRKWIDALYDQCRDNVFTPQNRREIGNNETLYVMTRLHQYNGRRCYVHIYYNNFTAAAEADAFDLKLTRWRNELLSKNENPDNKKYYSRYFIIKDTPKRGRKVTENEEAVNAARNKYSGFFSIMTNKKMDAVDVLDIYRRKDTIENSFDDLKNTLDMNRLRIHSSKAMDSRLFIQFIALILLSQVRSTAHNNQGTKRLSIREIMEAMETIVEVKYSGKYGSLITETDPLHRTIMAAFGVSVES